MTGSLAAALVGEGKTAVSLVNSLLAWSVARRHAQKVPGIHRWRCGTSGIRCCGYDRGGGYACRMRLQYRRAKRFDDLCGTRHGNRDAMALRSFGGQCGIDQKTSQLVGFNMENTVKIIKAIGRTRVSGQAISLRGLVEATRLLVGTSTWTGALARLRATFPVTS